MKPTTGQFEFDDKTKMRQEQRAVDATWAKEQYEAKGGDKGAYNFKPEFKGQSYEQQVKSKNNG